VPAPRPEAAAPPDLRPEALVEVEVRGRVTLPATGAPTGRPLVVVTDGPCFQPGTHYLGTARPDPAHPYFIEIFPPSGTRLEVCAALLAEGSRETPWWGRAPQGPLRAEGAGEVRLSADVAIARARTVTVPAGL
jgi:hypothetical protein